MTQDYYGTERVTALEQKDDEDGTFGYSVTHHADGYTSWLPKEVFDKIYQPLTALGFGSALRALQDGHKVRRPLWKEEVYIWLEKQGEYKFFRFTSTYGTSNFYPSNEDLLANDWQVVS